MLENKISSLRKEKNISQEELANILNTSRQAISKWERGEAYPDIEKLKDLATFFNVSIDYILDYDIESNSLNLFIKRIEDAIEKRSFLVSIDEIKMIISKNTNDFNLHFYVVLYLYTFINNESNEYIDLIISYCMKMINIFVPNNSNNVTLNNIHSTIVTCMILKGDYAGAQKYIIDNNVTESNLELAECAYELGDFNKATSLISDSFLDAIAKTISGNMLQIRVLFKTNKLDEAYDLTNWSMSFISSLDKKDSLFQELIYLLTFFKVCYEKYKGIDYKDSLDYLINNYNDFYNDLKINDSDSIKFYYNKKVTITTVVVNFEREMEYFKDSFIYNDAKDIYDIVFGDKK